MGISMHFQSNNNITAPKVGGFWIGCQAWTFNKRTVAEAIQLTAKAGGTTIEFFPGQKLEADSNEGLGPDNSDATIAKVKGWCAKAGITPVAFGVTGFAPNEADARKLATFAKRLGIRTIVTESGAAELKAIEPFLKDMDLYLAIHNHPRQPKNPNYKVWDPKYVLELVSPFDKRIGSCADTGHWVRSGIKPVDAMKILKGRIHASHLKDLNQFGEPHGHDVPYGTGVSDIPAILAEFRKQGYQGHLSVEYEINGDGPLDEVASCIGFVRGLGYSKK
jgi:sugar phosphate isomerase/epimerase